MLRHARRSDLPTIVDIWADAFAADPYLRWLVPDDAAWPAFAADWFGFVAGLTLERGHTYLDDGGVVVAVAWIPPDLTFAGPTDVARGASLLARHSPERAGLAVAAILAARAFEIEEPHWTLQYLGVRAAACGQGVGAAAVAPMLAVCDAEQLPCGLVSTNPRNLPFYERSGFAVAGEVPTGDGAVSLRPMRRAARP